MFDSADELYEQLDRPGPRSGAASLLCVALRAAGDDQSNDGGRKRADAGDPLSNGSPLQAPRIVADWHDVVSPRYASGVQTCHARHT
jgi:hypothetical protein